MKTAPLYVTSPFVIFPECTYTSKFRWAGSYGSLIYFGPYHKNQPTPITETIPPPKSNTESVISWPRLPSKVVASGGFSTSKVKETLNVSSTQMLERNERNRRQDFFYGYILSVFTHSGGHEPSVSRPETIFEQGQDLVSIHKGSLGSEILINSQYWT